MLFSIHLDLDTALPVDKFVCEINSFPRKCSPPSIYSNWSCLRPTNYYPDTLPLHSKYQPRMLWNRNPHFDWTPLANNSHFWGFAVSKSMRFSSSAPVHVSCVLISICGDWLIDSYAPNKSTVPQSFATLCKFFSAMKPSLPFLSTRFAPLSIKL